VDDGGETKLWWRCWRARDGGRATLKRELKLSVPPRRVVLLTSIVHPIHPSIHPSPTADDENVDEEAEDRMALIPMPN
jgi:hypothetical protein